MAEIRWAFKTVMSHYSYNSSSNLKSLFKVMFLDSEICKQISLSNSKMSYLIYHGLAPYFRQELLSCFEKCDFLVVSFDEVFNEVFKKEQMDLVSRYWDENTNRVAVRYLSSAFMWHATSEDILESFKSALNPIDIGKIIQISMDGPSVNWKFLELYNNKLREIYQKTLLNLGSCGLHVLHGSYQTGRSVAEWNINLILRSMCNLFKESLARRADFSVINPNSKFPKKLARPGGLKMLMFANVLLKFIVA